MEFIKRNKIVLAIAGTIIIIGGITLFFVLGSGSPDEKASPTAQQPTTPLPTYVPPSFSPTASAQEIARGWQEGNTPQYSILFSTDWTADVASIDGGGTAATFMPTAITGTHAFPRLQIEVSPSNTASSLDERLKTLAPLNLKRSDVLFHGIPTVMLQETLPFDFTVNSVTLTVHKTFLFFIYNNNSFNVNYSYYNDQNAPSNKQIIDTMLASFQVK